MVVATKEGADLKAEMYMGKVDAGMIGGKVKVK